MIWDAVGSYNQLPFHLRARGEFEFVKAKPLGDGFVGVPVTEIRGAMLRPFLEDRMSIAANFLIAQRLHRTNHRDAGICRPNRTH